MANCLYTNGYSLANFCGDFVGGAKEFYIANFSANTAYSYSSDGTITGMTPTTYYRIQQRREAGMWNDPHTQTEDGVNTWIPQCQMTFRKYQASTRDLVRQMTQTESSIIVLTNDGQYILLGEKNGLSTKTTENSGGQKFEDFSGHRVNFEGKEMQGARVISATAFGTLTIV